MDRIKGIKDYIIRWEGDGCDCWNYTHYPYLGQVLGNLDETESKQFISEIWNWDESQRYLIAYPISLGYNKYLDDFLYIKIFSKIKDTSRLNDLIDEVIPFIQPPYYLTKDIESWETDMIINLISNILRVVNIQDDKSFRNVLTFLNVAINLRNEQL